MGTLERGLVLGNCGRGPELAAYIAAMDKLRRLGETPGKFLRREFSNILKKRNVSHIKMGNITMQEVRPLSSATTDCLKKEKINEGITDLAEIDIMLLNITIRLGIHIHP